MDTAPIPHPSSHEDAPESLDAYDVEGHGLVGNAVFATALALGAGVASAASAEVAAPEPPRTGHWLCAAPEQSGTVHVPDTGHYGDRALRPVTSARDHGRTALHDRCVALQGMDPLADRGLPVVPRADDAGTDDAGTDDAGTAAAR